MSQNQLLVFLSKRDETCAECGVELRRGDYITLSERGVLCLMCSDLAHLVFLPSGDAALTVRAKRDSRLHAVVLKWSSARRQNERQGLLVEEDALRRAEDECLADAEARTRQRERAAIYRERRDQKYVRAFAACIRALLPNCPPGREDEIAAFACALHSGRVGRTSAAKAFSDDMITLAVRAHIRHCETSYDRLLAQGWDREDARNEVKETIAEIMKRWA